MNRYIKITDDAFDNCLRDLKPDVPPARKGTFPGTLIDGRIEIVRYLGSGSIGTVYEAKDRDRKIALKKLNILDAEHIYKIKQEYRLLTKFSHPNIIRVYDMFVSDGHWIFTMEIIDGFPIDIFVRRENPLDVDSVDGSRTINNTIANPEGMVSPHLFYEEDRLRNSFIQLVEGLAAIHKLGLLHRDLKPSNVLVEKTGRLVILDFGLVSAQLVGGVGQTIEGRIVGTPAYLAPELALQGDATVSADWYSVGVMLYEAFTGRLPYSGSPVQVLDLKCKIDPVPPSSINVSIHSDLNELCLALLDRNPKARPTTDQMLATCRGWRSFRNNSILYDRGSRSNSNIFVGRRRVLADLESAFRETQSGHSVVYLLYGEAGIGKTTLLREFVRYIGRITNPIVLEGCCYERERIPFKAFDTIIDSLTRILLRLPIEQTAQLLPRHSYGLLRLFPVLQRISLFKNAAEALCKTTDMIELHRQGREALKELLLRIADRRPLILLLDDIHWADKDSIDLLEEILSPPSSPSMLFVTTCRLRKRSIQDISGFFDEISITDVRDMHLDRLSFEETKQLALELFSKTVFDKERMADFVANKSNGVPLYAIELADYLTRKNTVNDLTSIEQLVFEKLENISPEARAVYETIIVACQPIPYAVFEKLCLPNQPRDIKYELLDAKFICCIDNNQTIDTYHNLIRNTVLSNIREDHIRRNHKRIIEVLESVKDYDYDRLAYHSEKAKIYDKAIKYSLLAARQAEEQLAFDQAANIYLRAIELEPFAETLDVSVYIKCAISLGACGRSPESAEMYLRAAKSVDHDTSVEYERLAAEQLLRCGHLSKAIKLLRRVLTASSIDWPESNNQALLSFVFNRLYIRARSLRFELRNEEEIDRDLIKKIDALYPAQTVYGTFDYLRGASFAARSFRLALKAGEPHRLATALVTEAIYGVMLKGSGGGSRALTIQRKVNEIVSGIDSPYHRALVDISLALCAYWEGRWGQVIEPAKRAEGVLRTQTVGREWEITLLSSICDTVCFHVGGLDSMQRNVSSGLVDAKRRNDLYATLEFSRASVGLYLVRNKTEMGLEKLKEVQEIVRKFPRISLVYLVMSAAVSLRLFMDQPQEAIRVLESQKKVCHKIGLHHHPLFRTMVNGMLAECVSVDNSIELGKRAKKLKRIAHRAAKEPIAWAHALACSVSAQAYCLEREYQLALKALRISMEEYLELDMFLDAEAVRYRIGKLTGGDQGKEILNYAEQRLKEEGITNPDSWSRIFQCIY